jgi:hypothetical protein
VRQGIRESAVAVPLDAFQSNVEGRREVAHSEQHHRDAFDFYNFAQHLVAVKEF